MRRLAVFNTVSLDGYFTGADGDMNWAHSEDPEWNAFVAENAKGGGALVFGRITYDQMLQFWPTPMAMEAMPDVAKGMNRMEKIVFSRTLKEATWNNTRLVNADPSTAMRKIKQEPGEDMAILGSGSIVAQLIGAGLIDEYQIVLKPVVLGVGSTMFEGVKNAPNLKRVQAREFDNGNVFLRYTPTR